ncbi:MAG: hypothetical protein K0R03_2253 [Moraxellaceae bacterium]|jgi:hypothetical protein|nr:hypothetical protein [Moraxellaceae bacterium]
MAVLRSTFLRLALAGAIASLVACGDDSAPAAPSGSATGTLSDSPVAGVSYSTSSGLTGTTDAQGRFRYNPGDIVTFRIGSLTLGAVTATGTDATITPLQIVESTSGLTETEQQNMVTNLLVLLQSLDSDGNAENGISIPAAVGSSLNATVAGTIDLQAAPATFAASDTLGDLATTAGGTVVDPEAALEHFRTQFFKDIAGVYSADLGNNEIIAFRVNVDGSYLMGEVATDDAAGQPGIERGKIEWNPQTGELGASNITLDTNGEWGLSDPLAEETLYLSFSNGKLLIKTDYDDPAATDETLELTRLERGTGIVGPWALNRTDVPAVSLEAQQFLFFANGRYLMLDTIGDEDANDCGSTGLEYGSYALAGGVLTTSAIIADTNGCAGLHDSGDYSSFDSVSIASGTLRTGEEVLLVQALPGATVYSGEAEVTGTTTGAPVVLTGATLFCTPPDTQGEISALKVAFQFDAAAGTFAMSYADEGEAVVLDGTYNPATGALAWQESGGPEVTLVTDDTTFFSEYVIASTATYNAAANTISGTTTDTITNSWTRSSARVACSAQAGFSLAPFVAVSAR